MMSGVFLILIMTSPGLNQIPSAMNPLQNKTAENKLLSGLLFYFISSDDLSRD